MEVREFEPQIGPTIRARECTAFVLDYIYKWIDVQVFSDIRTINRRPRVLGIFWCYSHSTGDVKEPKGLSRRVGNVASSVVVWPAYLKLGAPI